MIFNPQAMHSLSFSPKTALYSAQRGFLPGSTHRRGNRKSSDPLQNRCEQLSRHGDLRQLKEHVLRVPSHLRPDLYQLFPKGRQ